MSKCCPLFKGFAIDKDRFLHFISHEYCVLGAKASCVNVLVCQRAR